jgi:antitoxin HicB
MKEFIELTYGAKIIPQDDGYLVKFRDFDNIFTESDTFEEALHNAREALDGVLAQMQENNEHIPLPSACRKDEYPIPVSPEIAAPILLYTLRKKQAYTLSEVAKVMNIPYQQYQRLEHNGNMTLRSLKKAVIAMGGRVEIKLYIN